MPSCAKLVLQWLINAKQKEHMAKKHRDILQMQLDMLLKTKRYNETHDLPTRRASGEVVTNPKTGLKYKVVG